MRRIVFWPLQTWNILNYYLEQSSPLTFTVCRYYQEILGSEINRKTAKPQWVYCEISGEHDVVKILRESLDTAHLSVYQLFLSVWRSRLEPRVDEGVNPVIFPAPPLQYSAFIVGNLGRPGRIFSAYSLFKLWPQYWKPMGISRFFTTEHKKVHGQGNGIILFQISFGDLDVQV